MGIRKSILILIIVAVCLVFYFNALFGDFVYDDNIWITPNPYMKSFRFLPHFFLQDFGYVGTQKMQSNYYRPLLAASYMLDYSIWGNNPFGFHLTNLIFHIISCVLIFLLVILLTRERIIAFASALLFSVHPVHTEAVSFISGRVDVVTPVFFLLSLVFFLKYAFSRRVIYYLLSLFSFIVSLLTKEMAVTLPLIVLCVDYLFLSQNNFKKTRKNFLKFHFGFFVILALYLITRFFIMGKIFLPELPQGINFLPGTSPFWRLFTAIKVFIFYIRLLFFPVNLKLLYLLQPENFLFSPVVITGLGVLLMLIFIAVRNIKKQPILSFSISWFFITILPVSNIFPQGNIFAERFLYIPSVGFCIGIGFLFSLLIKKNIKTSNFNWNKLIYVVFFLFILFLGQSTYERNNVWKDDFTLWQETAKASPNSQVAHINLGSEYFKIGLLDKAIEETKKTLNLGTYYDYEALLLLGNIYNKKGLVDEAIKAFRFAIDMCPNREPAYYCLSGVYAQKGQYKEAIEVGLIALEKNPYLDDARYSLALYYKELGLIDEAINMYEEYLKTNPNYYGLYVDVGYLYYKNGNYNKAKEQWLKALEIKKDYQPAKDALKLLEN
ncbi:MAG: tetratricopeptide repeat protein [Candidatus Omnitrophota bacterium]